MIQRLDHKQAQSSPADFLTNTLQLLQKLHSLALKKEEEDEQYLTDRYWTYGQSPPKWGPLPHNLSGKKACIAFFSVLNAVTEEIFAACDYIEDDSLGELHGHLEMDIHMEEPVSNTLEGCCYTIEELIEKYE